MRDASVARDPAGQLIPSPTFRDATRDDVAAIVALLADDEQGRTRENASEPLDPRYYEAFDAIHADRGNRLLVVEQEREIVGTLHLTFLPGIAFHGGWRGQIESVRVASRLRSQGIGAAMIDWAVERCRERGCFMVQLTSHRDRAAAHRFYERLGWDRSHVGYKLKL